MSVVAHAFSCCFLCVGEQLLPLAGDADEHCQWEVQTLIVSLIVLWIVATRGALVACVCRVVRFIPLQGWILIRNSMTPSDVGDDLFIESQCSNYTFIMLYLIHEMDVDYMIVEEMIDISKLFDYTCVLSIGCNPILLITSTWLITCLKVFKASRSSLRKPLSLETFASLEVWPLGYDGSVLLSIVTQALLCNFLCAGSPSLLSSDAHDSCQCELLVSKNWIPYWSPSQA
jgi:hypothetical protein